MRGAVLVTGAAGFIGSHVAERLLARGDRVVGIDNFDPFYSVARKEANVRAVADAAQRGEGAGAFTFARLDLTDGAALRELMTAHGVTGVIHLAAKAGVRPSLQDPAGYMHANVTGTAVVLEAARAAVCTRVVVASSSSVYGNAATVPFAESADVNQPISPYAASKRACEVLGWTHWHLTKMPTALLRFFTVYGPRQRPDLAIGLFMKKIAAGETLQVYGQGTSRDYTYIDDIVTGVVSAYDRIDQHGYRVWNLGGNKPVDLDEMIATIGRVVGREPKLERRPMQPGDVERTWADLARSRTELGYAPTTDFAAGVRRQWEWWQREGRELDRVGER